MYRLVSIFMFLCITCTRIQADVPYQIWVTPKGDDPTPISVPLVIQPGSTFELTVWYSAPDIDPSPDRSYGLLGLEVCLGWDTSNQMGNSAVTTQNLLQLDGTLTQALTVYQTGPGGNALCGFREAAGTAANSVRPYGLQFSHASLQGFPASAAQKLFDIRLRNHALLPGQSQQIQIWDANSGVSYTSFLTPKEGQVIRLGTQSITVSCAMPECHITGKVQPGVVGMAGELLLIPDGQIVPADTIAVIPDPSGQFSATTTVTGLHTLRFVWRNHLVKEMKSVDIIQNTNLPVEVVLTNGDANQDGQINLFDFVVLDANFGAESSSADLNGDGVVNLFDYVIIDQSFGAQS